MTVFEAPPIVPLVCPLCRSRVVIALSVDDGFHQVQALCPQCYRESFVAVSSMWTSYVNGHAAPPTHAE